MADSMEPPVKKLKKDTVTAGYEEVKENDTQKALEEIDACQNLIDSLNEKASEDILRVEQKYNKMRKPFFEKRNEIIKRIPNFWITAFVNHPQITGLLVDEEEDCLHYLCNVEVEEFEDIKFGFKIHFHFEPNPYMENTLLTKEFHMGATVPCTQCTKIEWKEGHDLMSVIKERYIETEGPRTDQVKKTFFTWYNGNFDPTVDEIAEVIKDDLWPNPLQYYLVPDVGENGVEVVEDDDVSDDGGDSVVVVDDDDEEQDDDVIIEDDNDDVEENEKQYGGVKQASQEY